MIERAEEEIRIAKALYEVWNANLYVPTWGSASQMCKCKFIRLAKAALAAIERIDEERTAA